MNTGKSGQVARFGNEFAQRVAYALAGSQSAGEILRCGVAHAVGSRKMLFDGDAYARRDIVDNRLECGEISDAETAAAKHGFDTVGFAGRPEK